VGGQEQLLPERGRRDEGLYHALAGRGELDVERGEGRVAAGEVDGAGVAGDELARGVDGADGDLLGDTRDAEVMNACDGEMVDGQRRVAGHVDGLADRLRLGQVHVRRGQGWLAGVIEGDGDGLRAVVAGQEGEGGGRELRIAAGEPDGADIGGVRLA